MISLSVGRRSTRNSKYLAAFLRRNLAWENRVLLRKVSLLSTRLETILEPMWPSSFRASISSLDSFWELDEESCDLGIYLGLQ